MATKACLVVAMAAAALRSMVLGASYTVGTPGGSWDLRTNYTQWMSGIKFHASDQLVFTYSPAKNDVAEVSREDYDACSASTPLASFCTGRDIMPLTAVGIRHFICGVDLA